MALTDIITTKAEKMHGVLMKIPDKFLVGPMLEWKKEYKRLTKEVRRGRTTPLEAGREFAYEQAGDNVEMQKKIADMIKLVNKLDKTKKEVEKKIKPAQDAIKWYLFAKASLVMAAEVAEKANEIASVSPPNPVAKAIAWFQRKTKTEGLDEVKLLKGYVKNWEIWEKKVLKRYIKSWLDPLVDALNGFRDAQIRRAGRAKKWVGSEAAAVGVEVRGGYSPEEETEEPVIDPAVVAALDIDDTDDEEDTDEDTGGTETTGSNYP